MQAPEKVADNAAENKESTELQKLQQRVAEQAKKEGVPYSTVWNRACRRMGVNPQHFLPKFRLFRPNLKVGEIVEVTPPSAGEEITMRRVEKLRGDGRVTLWRDEKDVNHVPGTLLTVKKNPFTVISVGYHQTRLRPATPGEIVAASAATFPAEANMVSEGSFMMDAGSAALMQAVPPAAPGTLSPSQIARRQRKANSAKGWPEEKKQIHG
jgi:hypothetical protein